MATLAHTKPNISLPAVTETIESSLYGIQRVSIGGYIAYFDLVKWWFKAFDRSERNHIKSLFRLPGYEPDSLARGNIFAAPADKVRFLVELAGLFGKPYNRHIGHRILDQAERAFCDHTRFADAHFFYDQRIRLTTADHRLDPKAVLNTIINCELQIFIAADAARELSTENGQLPYHRGYQQLATLGELKLDYQQTLQLSKQALKQGWAGNWQARIQRCQQRVLASKARWV